MTHNVIRRLIASSQRLPPLRKVIKCEDRGYYWALTLECGHHSWPDHAMTGKGAKKRPIKKRCLSCLNGEPAARPMKAGAK